MELQSFALDRVSLCSSEVERHPYKMDVEGASPSRGTVGGEYTQLTSVRFTPLRLLVPGSSG